MHATTAGAQASERTRTRPTLGAFARTTHRTCLRVDVLLGLGGGGDGGARWYDVDCVCVCVVVLLMRCALDVVCVCVWRICADDGEGEVDGRRSSTTVGTVAARLISGVCEAAFSKRALEALGLVQSDPIGGGETRMFILLALIAFEKQFCNISHAHCQTTSIGNKTPARMHFMLCARTISEGPSVVSTSLCYRI